MGATDLSGQRILIVEDEFFVALQLEHLVRAAGADVVGPVASLERALPLAHVNGLDGALLDVNLAGRRVTPVAEALATRGIPFILVTSYGRADLPEPVLQRAPRVAKGTAVQDLEHTMGSVFCRA